MAPASLRMAAGQASHLRSSLAVIVVMLLVAGAASWGILRSLPPLKVFVALAWLLQRRCSWLTRACSFKSLGGFILEQCPT